MHPQIVSQESIRRSRKRTNYLTAMKSYYKVFFVCIILSSVILILLPQLYIAYNHSKQSPLAHIKSSILYKMGLIRRNQYLRHEEVHDASEDDETEDSEEMECRIPKQDPFDPVILPHLEDNFTLNCQSKYPLLFTSNESSFLHQVGNPRNYGLSTCCYRNLIRFRGSDNSVGLSRKCIPILSQVTEISSFHEFISISCKHVKTGKYVFIDMIGFAPIKPEVQLHISVRKKKLQRQTLSKGVVEDRMNVVILGLDSLSHMNFIRVMPKTNEFLKENLSSIGMNGYTTVGDGTYPNAIAFMTGLNQPEFSKCHNNNASVFFDDCPFIWKKYSAKGYATSLAEDSPSMSIYNYGKSGFNNSPVDYYLRPLTFLQDDLIGNINMLNGNLCYGPRSGFDVILDYLKKLAYTMQTNKQNYLQIAWATSLFHDFLSSGKYGENPFMEFLTWFHNSNYFNNTAFVLMSDHGMRWGNVLWTIQGRLEQRMPFLNFVLPPWFHKKYSKAVENLRINSKRLTTPFDLHETIKDLLNLKGIQNQEINKKARLLKSESLPRAISLFLPVPKSRNCEDAKIPFHYCVCNIVQQTTVPIDHPEVKNVGSQAVNVFNTFFEQHATGKCAMLELKEIIFAETILESSRRSKYKMDSNERFLLTLGFRTMPGNGTFQATFEKDKNLSWKFSDATRTNLYGNQSYCVEGFTLKKFCYCKTFL